MGWSLHYSLPVAAPLSQNGSFEDGTSPWQVGGTTNFVIYANGRIAPGDMAFSGTHYAAMNTSRSAAGSVYEDATGLTNGPGDTICGSAYVRDQLQEYRRQRQIRDLAPGGALRSKVVNLLLQPRGRLRLGGDLLLFTATIPHTEVRRTQFFPTPGSPTVDIDSGECAGQLGHPRIPVSERQL